MIRTFILLGLTAVALGAAPITFTLVQPDLTGAPGSTLLFRYNVTNNSATTIFGLAINADPFVSGHPDASPFDAFGSGIAPGATLIGQLYSFTADPGVSNSFNNGVFDLLVVDSTLTQTDLFANYSVTIAPLPQTVPEPSSFGLLLLGACLAGGLHAKRRSSLG